MSIPRGLKDHRFFVGVRLKVGDGVINRRAHRVFRSICRGLRHNRTGRLTVVGELFSVGVGADELRAETLSRPERRGLMLDRNWGMNVGERLIILTRNEQ